MRKRNAYAEHWLRLWWSHPCEDAAGDASTDCHTSDHGQGNSSRVCVVVCSREAADRSTNPHPHQNGYGFCAGWILRPDARDGVELTAEVDHALGCAGVAG